MRQWTQFEALHHMHKLNEPGKHSYTFCPCCFIAVWRSTVLIDADDKLIEIPQAAVDEYSESVADWILCAQCSHDDQMFGAMFKSFARLLNYRQLRMGDPHERACRKTKDGTFVWDEPPPA